MVSAKTLVDRQLGRNIKHPILQAVEDYIIPNRSGDHTAGTTGTPVNDSDIANKKFVVDEISASPHTPEGTAVKSTGEGGGTKFLREDGDDTCSWQAPSAAPAGSDHEIQFNNNGSLGGDPRFKFTNTTDATFSFKTKAGSGLLVTIDTNSFKILDNNLGIE